MYLSLFPNWSSLSLQCCWVMSLIQQHLVESPDFHHFKINIHECNHENECLVCRLEGLWSTYHRGKSSCSFLFVASSERVYAALSHLPCLSSYKMHPLSLTWECSQAFPYWRRSNGALWVTWQKPGEVMDAVFFLL